MLTMPPPLAALLPVTWLLFSTSVGVGWPAKKIAFVIPPPRRRERCCPRRRSCSASR
jgi:hypothetical protein